MDEVAVTYSISVERAKFCEKCRREVSDEEFLEWLGRMFDPKQKAGDRLAAWLALKPGDEWYLVNSDEMARVVE